MFFSKSFTVSGLTFRSLIYFEFIFVWKHSSWPNNFGKPFFKLSSREFFLTIRLIRAFIELVFMLNALGGKKIP